MGLPKGFGNKGCTAQLPEQLEWENLTVSSVGEDVEQLELSRTANENTKLYSFFGKVYLFLIKLNIHLSNDPAIHSYVLIQRK